MASSSTFRVLRELEINEETRLMLTNIDLLYDGKVFKITVDQTLADRLSTDGPYAQEYCQMLQNYGYRGQELGVGEEEERIMGPVFPSAREANTTSEVDERLANECPERSAAEFRWTRESILLLISLRESFGPRFESGQKKKNLWDTIAKEMSQCRDISNITGVICDTKWRSLLQSYRKKRDKLNSSGEENITWEYFESINKIVGKRPSSCPPKDRLIGSISAVAVEESTDSSQTPSPDVSSSAYLSLTATLENEALVQQGISGKKKLSALKERKRKATQSPSWFEDSERREEMKAIREEMRVQHEADNLRWEKLQAVEEKKLESFDRLTSVLTEILKKKL